MVADGMIVVADGIIVVGFDVMVLARLVAVSVEGDCFSLALVVCV